MHHFGNEILDISMLVEIVNIIEKHERTKFDKRKKAIKDATKEIYDRGFHFGSMSQAEKDFTGTEEDFRKIFGEMIVKYNLNKL